MSWQLGTAAALERVLWLECRCSTGRQVWGPAVAEPRPSLLRLHTNAAIHADTLTVDVIILDELTTGLDPRARRSTWDGVQHIRDAGVTVILVTHFMDEVERLCDRVMVLDQGRIAALDTPQDLIRHGGSEQVMTFMASEAISIEELLVLPDVAEAESRGGRVKVTGGGDMVLNVLTALADSGGTPERLRVDHTSLEDAYLALTGESSGSADSE